MTAAVCIKCGTMKTGAFTPCAKCGFTPESAEDQARSMLLSDHNMEDAALRQVGMSIAAGTPPSFDEAGVSQMAAEFKEFRKHPPPGKGCSIIWWSLLGLMVVLFIAIVFLTWYIKRGH